MIPFQSLKLRKKGNRYQSFIFLCLLVFPPPCGSHKDTNANMYTQSVEQIFLIITASAILSANEVNSLHGGVWSMRETCKLIWTYSLVPPYLLPISHTIRSYSLPLPIPDQFWHYSSFSIIPILHLLFVIYHSISPIRYVMCACAADRSIRLPLTPVTGHIISH